MEIEIETIPVKDENDCTEKMYSVACKGITWCVYLDTEHDTT